MAAVAKDGSPSLATATPPTNSRFSDPLVAGENLAAGDACYLNTDGKVYRASGATAGVAAARILGYAAMDHYTGEPVTLYDNVNFHYTQGATPGTRVFLSGTTAGGLDTVASTGGTVAAGIFIDANKVRLRSTWQNQ